MKFAVLQEHSGGVIHSNLERLLGRRAVSRSTVMRWAAQFRRGDPSVEEARGGDHRDAEIRQQRVAQIEACFDESRHWSLRSLASITSIPPNTVKNIVQTDLCMTKKLGKWLPRELRQVHKDL